MYEQPDLTGMPAPFPGVQSLSTGGEFLSDEDRKTLRDKERLFPEVFTRKLDPSPLTGSTPGRVERKKWVTRRSN